MSGDALEDASRALSGSALRAEMREGRGRCLVAQRRIRKGEVVLEEDAFAAVLYPNKVSDYCDYEMTMGSGKLLRCSKTRVARYSSKQAQASAWKTYYRDEANCVCAMKKKYAEDNPFTDHPYTRLLARVYWTRKSRPALQWRLVDQLCCHWPAFSDEKKAEMFKAAGMARAALSFAPPSDEHRDAIELEDEMLKEMTMTLARIDCNGLTICGEGQVPIGFGVFPLAALANHSCNPNCVQTFVGRRLFYRSIRDIEIGEEVTITYVPLSSVHAERRADLLDSFYFDIGNRGREGEEAQGEELATVGEAGAVEFYPPADGGFASIPASLADEDERKFTSLKVGDRGGRGLVLGDPDLRGGATFYKSGLRALCSFDDRKEARLAGLALLRIHCRLVKAEDSFGSGKLREAGAEAWGALNDCEGLSIEGSRVRLGKHHITRIRALSLFMDITIHLGDFMSARSTIEMLCGSLRVLCSKPAAAVGTTSFVLAILAKLEADPLSGGSPETAVAVAKEALPLLDFLRPSSDSVIAEVQAIMNDCLAELRLGGEDA